MPTRLMQRNNIVNGFVLVNDESTDKALAQAKSEVGEADWKKGYSPESEKVAREALKAHGARYEKELSGKLVGVELAETHANGTAFKKLRVTLENDRGDRTILSSDLGGEFAQRLIAKLDTAADLVADNPGMIVTIGGFAEQVEKDGRTFANHVATMKDAEGKEIPAEKHFDKAQEAVAKAREPMIASGMGDNKEVMSKIAKAAREQYFAGVVQEIAGRFPEREQAQGQKQEFPRLEAHLKTEQGTWHSVGLYVDQEGKARGTIAVENQEQGIKERHRVEFQERASKSGIPMLSASAEREDGSKLYVNILPHENGTTGEKFLSAAFGQKAQGMEFQQIDGKGGGLNPNEAMVQLGDKDRTAQFVQEKLGVDALANVKAKAQEQAVGAER